MAISTFLQHITKIRFQQSFLQEKSNYIRFEGSLGAVPQNSLAYHHIPHQNANFGVPPPHCFQTQAYGGFLSHRGTPVHPPFLDGIFHEINHPASLG